MSETKRSLYEHLTDDELINYFNSGVGVRAWGTGRAMELKCMLQQFDNTNIDYSVIIGSTEIGGKSYRTISLAKKVRLDNNKLYRL